MIDNKNEPSSENQYDPALSPDPIQTQTTDKSEPQRIESSPKDLDSEDKIPEQPKSVRFFWRAILALSMIGLIVCLVYLVPFTLFLLVFLIFDGPDSLLLQGFGFWSLILLYAIPIILIGISKTAILVIKENKEELKIRGLILIVTLILAITLWMHFTF